MGCFKGNWAQKLLMRKHGSPPENWAISVKALHIQPGILNFSHDLCQLPLIQGKGAIQQRFISGGVVLNHTID